MQKVTQWMPWVLILFLVLACSKKGEQVPKGVAAPTNPMTQPLQTGVAEKTISGTINIDPSLASKMAPTDVMYIIARSVDKPSPPVAVQQVRNVQFPYHYTLSSADVMMQGTGFEGKVNILAKLKRSGAAGPPQPGDMEGDYANNPASVGDQHVDIVINKIF